MEKDTLRQCFPLEEQTAIFGAEKGGNIGKLHLQGVVRRNVAGAAPNKTNESIHERASTFYRLKNYPHGKCCMADVCFPS